MPSTHDEIADMYRATREYDGLTRDYYAALLRQGADEIEAASSDSLDVLGRLTIAENHVWEVSGFLEHAKDVARRLP